MRLINKRFEKTLLSLCLTAKREYFFTEDSIVDIINYALYNIKDIYFEEFRSKYFSDNKCENRPYYCAFTDKKGIIWFIPLSTQIESYADKIKKDEAKYGNCLFYHIGKINNINRVFLIGNMFPVTANYIKKPYTIGNTHYIVGNKELIKQIHKKAIRYLALVEHNKLDPQIDIMKIRAELYKN